MLEFQRSNVILQALNYLKLASRLDATAARIKSAIGMKDVMRQMGPVVKGAKKNLSLQPTADGMMRNKIC